MVETNTEAKTFDEIADAVFDQAGKQTPEDSSSETKAEDQTETPEATGTEPDKTEQVKAVDGDDTLTPEDKLKKIEEILGDDQDAIDAYIKQKGYHKDPAWIKQRELIEKLRKESSEKAILSQEDKEALEEFKKFRSSSEYIQTSMKAQGYTQEAIDKKLKESGFEVQVKPEDDVQLVVNKLGIKLDKLTPEAKASVIANIEDVVKIADILFQDRMNKVLPKELAPVKDHLSNIERTENASKLVNTMKETVKTEGILDYSKDIEPAINKFLDENPDASQHDVMEHFRTINHSLSVERLRTGKRKEERDEKKSTIRQNLPVGSSKPTLPKKTGNFDADADAFFDAVGYHE